MKMKPAVQIFIIVFHLRQISSLSSSGKIWTRYKQIQDSTVLINSSSEGFPLSRVNGFKLAPTCDNRYSFKPTYLFKRGSGESIESSYFRKNRVTNLKNQINDESNGVGEQVQSPSHKKRFNVQKATVLLISAALVVWKWDYVSTFTRSLDASSLKLWMSNKLDDLSNLGSRGLIMYSLLVRKKFVHLI